MSDLTLNRFVASGTTAERLAFTPSPPTPASGPDSGYVWFDTDLVILYAWDGAAWQPASTGGKVVQVVNVETGAVSTGVTTVPLDDTIPQNTEGDQYMSLSITPTNAGHKLKIEVVLFGTVDGASWIIAALFQDTTAGALAAFANYQDVNTGPSPIVFTHYMAAGTTSATTFKVRAGRDGSGGTTLTFNGQSGARKFGGVLASSITITEIIP